MSDLLKSDSRKQELGVGGDGDGGGGAGGTKLSPGTSRAKGASKLGAHVVGAAAATPTTPQAMPSPTDHAGTDASGSDAADGGAVNTGVGDAAGRGSTAGGGGGSAGSGGGGSAGSGDVLTLSPRTVSRRGAGVRDEDRAEWAAAASSRWNVIDELLMTERSSVSPEYPRFFASHSLAPMASCVLRLTTPHSLAVMASFVVRPTTPYSLGLMTSFVLRLTTTHSLALMALCVFVYILPYALVRVRADTSQNCEC